MSWRTRTGKQLHLSEEADQERVERIDVSKRWIGSTNRPLVRSGLYVARVHQSDLFEIEIYAASKPLNKCQQPEVKVRVLLPTLIAYSLPPTFSRPFLAKRA